MTHVEEEKTPHHKQKIHLVTKTGAQKKGNAFVKDLAPIEAVTEYVGDWIYYQLLINKQPVYLQKDYKAALMPKATFPHLSITKSTKKVPKKVATHGDIDSQNDDNSEDYPTPKEQKQTPPHHLLQYSRPYFNTIPYQQKEITTDIFTVRNIQEIAIIGWADILLLNNDRFMFQKGRPNWHNMMLSPRKTKGFVFIPIDQGFARQVTAPWYKWLPTYDYSSYPNPQLIYTEQWLNNGNAINPFASEWIKSYPIWLKAADKAAKFVNNNLIYFPENLNQELIKKVIDIVNIYWNYYGVELCTNIGDLAKGIFTEINDNKPNIKGLLPNIKGGIFKTRGQWKRVQKVIWDQIKQCVGFKPTIGSSVLERKIKVINSASAKDVLLKDFHYDTLPTLNDDEKHEIKQRRESISKSVESIKKDSFLKDITAELQQADNESPLNQKPVNQVAVNQKAKQLQFNNYYEYNYDSGFNLPHYRENQYLLHSDELQTVLSFEIVLVFVLMIIIFIGGVLIGVFGAMIAVKRETGKVRVNDEESQY